MYNLDDVIHEMKKMQDEILMLKDVRNYFVREMDSLNAKYMSLRCENDLLKYEVRKLTNPEEFI